MKDEKKFFLKYLAREFWKDIKKVGQGATNIFRPKLWFVIVGIALITMLAMDRKAEAIICVLLLIFVWGWDIYEAGAWKHEYRKKSYAKIREKVKNELPEYEKNR